MSTYKLPKTNATVEMAHPLGVKEYSYPYKRKDLENCLKEALDLLWQIQSNPKGEQT